MKTLLTLSALMVSTLTQAATLQVTGLQTPESALYDEVADVYLVTSVGGDPFAADNNGYISQVSPEGKILNERWIAGGTNGITLHSPKGMTLVKDTLFVTDMDTVRLFDRKTGRYLRSIKVKGAEFLNDLTHDLEGNVYVSDSALLRDFKHGKMDAVYQITPDLKLNPIAQGPELAEPNGLLVTREGELVVAPFGSADLYTVKNGMPERLVKLPGGQLDGIVQVGDRLVVSSWETQTLYSVGSKGDIQVLLKDLPSPADLGYDSKRNRILIPILSENRLVIQDL